MSEDNLPTKSDNQPMKPDSEGPISQAGSIETSMGKEIKGGAADQGEVPIKNEGDASTARRGRFSRTGLLGLILLLLTAGAAGALWWQYQHFSGVVDQLNDAYLAYGDSAASLEQARVELRALGDRLDLLNATSELNRQVVNQNTERIETLSTRLLNVGERLNAVQGVSEDARRRWLKAEAEYYLAVANGELQLAGNWENSIVALALAEEKLQELANPAFSVVRERIQTEIQALRAVQLPDTEELSFSLGMLASRVDGLPMRSELAGSYRNGREPLAGAEPGISRLWQSLKDVLAGMVSIERLEEPVARALSLEQRNLLRQQVALALNTAQLALLRGQPEIFRQSLTAASNILSQDFVSADPLVRSALTLLQDMLVLDIAPARPNISGSLSLLRNLQSGER